MEKLAETSVPINLLISRRWSPRAFDPTKIVESEKILSICEAARWAPSCSNFQPWRFIIWNKYSNANAFLRAFETLDYGNKRWVTNATILIGVFAHKYWNNEKKEINRWASFDTGSATMSLLLQCFDLGLYAHPMAGFDAKKLKEEFSIPDEYEAIAMVAIGYPGDPYTLEEPYLAREFNHRQRSPLETRFFDSEWEKPIIDVKKGNFNVG